MPITSEELIKQLTEVADEEIKRVKEFIAQPISEENLVVLAEDMFWGQESRLGDKLGDLAVQWLIRKLEAEFTVIIRKEETHE